MRETCNNKSCEIAKLKQKADSLDAKFLAEANRVEQLLQELAKYKTIAFSEQHVTHEIQKAIGITSDLLDLVSSLVSETKLMQDQMEDM